ncbi:PilW family protein [Fontivita pretiosa]|uniref:PilW family protein n=1 Tax=Fontivita pretiosa TaxID=2989684 RepID=UPI003D1796B0
MRTADRGTSMKGKGMKSRRRHRGMSLVEALISLSISAMLLTGVGAAYQASSEAVRHNDQFYRASQAARVSINQIVAEVRKCQSGVVDSDSLELTTNLGETRIYAYDPTNRCLNLTIQGSTPVTYRMASNVESLQFQTDGQTIVMTVTVKVGPNQVTLNGSAIPRRTVTYE